MKKKGEILVLIISVICLVFAGCSTSSSAHNVFTLPKLHNGDAKFFGDKIVTNLDGNLTLFDSNGDLFKTYDVQVNWIDICLEDYLIIYGNFNKEIGIARFNAQYELLENKILWTSENLNIDPTVIKLEDTYYFTSTEIKGSVNNGDTQKENGFYSIKLYQTKDFDTYEYVTDIASYQSNLEDADLVKIGDSLALTFEKEVVDKANSEIMIALSDSEYRNWDSKKVLLEADCDHEPASFFVNEDGTYSLYYSCDKDDIGESYMGSRVYEATYDSDFKMQSNKQIKLTTETGILLYDVFREDKTSRMLYARNYLTDCDLVQDQIKGGVQ